LVQHQKPMDLDPGIHTQASVLISSNGSSRLPPAILFLLHTQLAVADKLVVLCLPRTRDCYQENERSNLCTFCCHLHTNWINFQTGVSVNKFSPVRERQKSQTEARQIQSTGWKVLNSILSLSIIFPSMCEGIYQRSLNYWIL